jgi:DNA adenine methylase
MAPNAQTSTLAGVVLTSAMRNAPSELSPILKWPGGKRWLAKALVISLGFSAKTYVTEPFVGGGALFFGLCPYKALLGDINIDLIACYRAIRDTPHLVSDRLQELTIDQSTFTSIASTPPHSDVDRAIRLIYLNRTAFGGIWRVNRVGNFNVPFGCKPETRLPDAEVILRASQVLQAASLYVGDFAVGLDSSREADLIYCDPPYTVSHNNNGFIRYNEKIFSWADQRRLSESVQALAQDGRGVIISNAAHKDVIHLYPSKLFARAIVHRRSNLAADSRYRGMRQEALFVSKALIKSDRNLHNNLYGLGLAVDIP